MRQSIPRDAQAMSRVAKSQKLVVSNVLFLYLVLTPKPREFYFVIPGITETRLSLIPYFASQAAITYIYIYLIAYFPLAPSIQVNL